MGVQFGRTATDRARRRTSVRPSTATTASATAASSGTLDADDYSAPELRRRQLRRRCRRDDYLVHVGHHRRHLRQPALQVHAGRGHQHRQRRRVRPADPAAGVRRRTPHRRRRRSRHRPVSGARRRGSNGLGRRDRAGVDTDRQRDVRRHRRLALRGHGTAAVRHEARAARQRQVDRADVQRTSPTCRSRAASGAASSTTSTSPPIRSRSTTARRPGIPFAPVGIYDYTNRLVHDRRVRLQRPVRRADAVDEPDQLPDPVGRVRQPLPLRRQRPGHAGPAQHRTTSPSYRTIAAEFEAMPGVIVPADLAPTQVGVVQLPGAQRPGGQLSLRPGAPTTPQLFTVDSRTPTRFAHLTISGQGFGGTGQVTLDGTTLPTIAGATPDRRHRSRHDPGRAPPADRHHRRRSHDRQRPDLPRPERPTTGVPDADGLDTFNRANASNLGPNWSQIVLFGQAALRVNDNQAVPIRGARSGTVRGRLRQCAGAAFTIANTRQWRRPVLKRASASAYIRVRYSTSSGGQDLVESTTNTASASRPTATSPQASPTGTG